MAWILCLSKGPKSKKINVKVLSENYVPKKGEKLQIVGKFENKKNAQLCADPDIKNRWGKKKPHLTDIIVLEVYDRIFG